MASVQRAILLVALAATVLIAVPVILSGTLRSAYLSTIARKIASIWPPDFAFVGDSLTARCGWRRELHTLSVINLAVGGMQIRDVVHQVIEARHLAAKTIVIEAGINDILLDHAATDRIAYDFDDLMRKIPDNQRAIVTLIPYVADRTQSAKIAEANAAIKRIAEARKYPVIDLNPQLSSQGDRKPEMTTDGVHLTPAACTIWAGAVREIIASPKGGGKPS